MQIGKPGTATTAISTASADRIEVRGKDLCADLMGRLGFTEYFHLLLTGREPSADQRFFLDLLLVSIAEHGLVPSVQAARMTHAAEPDALQAAVAAGILGSGSVILGASESCARLIEDGLARIKAGTPSKNAARDMVTEIKQKGRKVPGFGHPLHKPVDPRSARILALAGERGIAGRATDFASELRGAITVVYGREMPMNVSMAIAAVLLDLEFPAAVVKSIPILARTASLLAHLAEEGTNPIGFRMAAAAESAIGYDPEAGPR